MGPVQLGAMRAGSVRRLNAGEIGELHKAVDL
jgi:hypothetical protein